MPAGQHLTTCFLRQVGTLIRVADIVKGLDSSLAHVSLRKNIMAVSAFSE